MAEEERLGVNFSIGNTEINTNMNPNTDTGAGVINRGFVFDPDDERKMGNEDERESDYYSASPVDSLKIVDDEAENSLGKGTPRKCPTTTQTSRLSHQSSNFTINQNQRTKAPGKQKWRDLTMGTSFVYAICLTIIHLALLVSEILSAHTVTADTLLAFLVVMFSVSILSLGSILSLSAFGKLTNDEHYKKRGKSTFIRGGMLVLGTGMIIYSSLNIATYINTDPLCREAMSLATAILCLMFTVGQISFLLVYNKIRINNSLQLSIVSRYLMMQVIATNLCVWLGLVFFETLEEINNHNEDPVSDSFFSANIEYHKGLFDAENMGSYFEGTLDVNHTACNSTELTITSILTPYLFPLIIEFCVMASCMCLAVWENCGNGWVKAQSGEDQEIDTTVSMTDVDSVYMISKSEASSPQHSSHTTHPPSNYFNNNIGLVLGWAVIVGSVVIIIVVLYYLYSGKNQEVKESIIFGLNMAISIACLFALPLTFYKMSKLTFKDDEIKGLRVKNGQPREGQHAPSSYKGTHRQTDKTLLFNTYIAMMILKLFTMIAAYESNEPVLFADGIASILFGFMQTLFINWYAFQKRVTTEEDREQKPGRQGLEFLRCANFALWLVNSFLLKNEKAKRVMYDIFGFEAWAILSNIFQPLTILYYFHSMVCLAEIIGHTYTAKYIGVARPWKRPKVRNGQISKSYSTNSLRCIPVSHAQQPELTTF